MKYNEIKTLEDCCKVLGTTLNEEIPAEAIKHLTEDEIAYRQVKLIARALNQADNDGKPWTPNWNDHNEWKYYPWFEITSDEEHPSGVGLSYYVYDLVLSTSVVGSRLCFKSRELAKYAGQTFNEVYQRFFLIKD